MLRWWIFHRCLTDRWLWYNSETRLAQEPKVRAALCVPNFAALTLLCCFNFLFLCSLSQQEKIQFDSTYSMLIQKVFEPLVFKLDPTI